VIRRRAGGKANDKLASLSEDALHLGRATVHFDKPFDQGQADAETALRPVQGALGLREEFEDSRKELGRNPEAGVADAKDDLIGIRFDRGHDTPGRIGVLGGIIKKVDQHLFKAGGIGVEPDRLGRLVDQLPLGRKRGRPQLTAVCSSPSTRARSPSRNGFCRTGEPRSTSRRPASP